MQLSWGQPRGPGRTLTLLTAPLLLARNSAVGEEVGQNTGEPQEARCSKKKPESQKLESTGKPKESKPKVGVEESHKAQQSLAAGPERGQVEPKIPGTSRGHGLGTCPGAQGRQLLIECPQVIFLKTHQQRTAKGDMEQLEAGEQGIWFEGLPTRVHLPGPRVMCRSSTLRLVKRCCTRFCSASLELPRYRPHRM